MWSKMVEISKPEFFSPKYDAKQIFNFFCTIVRPNLADLDAKFGHFWEIKITDTNLPKMSSRI